MMHKTIDWLAYTKRGQVIVAIVCGLIALIWWTLETVLIITAVGLLLNLAIVHYGQKRGHW